MRRNGKAVLVTGATSGIGLAAVKLLAETGAFVMGVGRSQKRNEVAKRSVISDIPDAKVTYLLADLAEQEEVKRLAAAVFTTLKKHGKPVLDVLVNNAGVYLEKRQITRDGIEMTFAVNHLAPFLLTYRLQDAMLRAQNPRVLTVSSYSHKTTPLSLKRIAVPFPYIGLLAYKRSKLCNILFTYELNRRFEWLEAFAVDPGLVNTGIASKGGRGISDLIWRRRRKLGTSPSVPARTIRYLALEEDIDKSNGFYFKDCAPKSPSNKAVRKDLALALWELSEELTHVKS